MNMIILYFIFGALVAVFFIIALIMAHLCKKWHNAYYKLKDRYEVLKRANVCLQKELYKLTYTTPGVETKKGRNGNGTK